MENRQRTGCYHFATQLGSTGRDERGQGARVGRSTPWICWTCGDKPKRAGTAIAELEVGPQRLDFVERLGFLLHRLRAVRAGEEQLRQAARRPFGVDAVDT